MRCFYPNTLQEIPLSEILQVEPAQDFSNLPQGSNPHCFEVITGNMVFYVGEDNNGLYHNPVMAASGVGRDVGQSWEKAIRQAMMPVTPKASVGTGPGQAKDHSEYPSEATTLVQLHVPFRIKILKNDHIVKTQREFYWSSPDILWFLERNTVTAECGGSLLLVM